MGGEGSGQWKLPGPRVPLLSPQPLAHTAGGGPPRPSSFQPCISSSGPLRLFELQLLKLFCLLKTQRGAGIACGEVVNSW